MRFMVYEKRKFNWVVLGLLAATVVLWAARVIQEGRITLPI